MCLLRLLALLPLLLLAGFGLGMIPLVLLADLEGRMDRKLVRRAYLERVVLLGLIAKCLKVQN
jgi:hypothetical protein